MKTTRLLGSMLAVATLVACGGSGGGGGSDRPGTTVSGSVFAAPVSGASVTVWNGSGSRVAGPARTGADGTYQIKVPNDALAGDLRFEASGGTYTDEATGTSGVPLDRMTALVPAGTLGEGSQVHVTPASTVVHDLVSVHGKTLSGAETLSRQAFGFAPDPSVAPANAPVSQCGCPSALAGLQCAAFSQLTLDLGLSADQQFALLRALALDLKDGALDGKVDATTPVEVKPGTNLPTDILYKFSLAHTGFLDSAKNQTGMDTGVALTPTYRVEYVPGGKAPVQGRTEFAIRVTRRSDGTPVTGLSLSLAPLMHMTSKNHATPLDLPIVDNGDGTYSCALYYLMNSGPAMGYWELKVVIGGMGGETATFYPNVAMPPAGGTARAMLRGQADVEASTMVPANRRYFLFNDGLTADAGGHTFRLFLAAYDSMMSWPAVQVGTVLHPPAPTPEWTVTDVAVEASTDGTTWVAGTSTGAHWTLANLQGLTGGVQGHVYVRLIVNGEQKTTDGSAPSGANGYADFTVTPAP